MAHILEFSGHRPDIDDTAFLAVSATVIGQAKIAPGASVFFGAVVRADSDAINLGPGSNLQDNVVVHTDNGIATRIGTNVSVGHGAVVHGATVEDGCLIGMNATLLNNCIIGAESLVAAGALVLENTVIPPRSLVAGVPAKVRRELTDDEVAALAANAQHYQELAAKYREEVSDN